MVAMNCLHELIEAQARRTPRAPALAFEGTTPDLRASSSAARSALAARRCARLGAGPDVRVGLFVERSLEMVVGILGILKAGAAYVPMDTALSAASASPSCCPMPGAGFVLTQAQLAAKLPAHGAQSSAWMSSTGAAPATPLGDVGVGPANLAYVIYTSGSTGPPERRLHRASQHRQLRARRRRAAAARARHERTRRCRPSPPTSATR